MKFVKNAGTVDRVIRIILGVGLISQVFTGVHSPWFWFGLVPLLSGVTGFCPAYLPFGIRTCPIRKTYS